VSNNISTVSDAETNGFVVVPYTTNLATFVLTGLTANFPYYFNVVVKDSVGNKAAYVAKKVQTAAQ
jgi:hypothetical protein